MTETEKVTLIADYLEEQIRHFDAIDDIDAMTLLEELRAELIGAPLNLSKAEIKEGREKFARWAQMVGGK